MQKQDRNAPVCGAAPRVGCSGCRSGGMSGGAAGCPVVSVLGRPGRHTAKDGRRFGRPLLEKGLAVGSVCGARFRVWHLSGAAGASGGVRPGACVRLPGRGYCSSSVIETLTCSLTKSPASSDAASRGTNSSSVKPIRYSRALYEPFWGPSMSVKFSVRLSF